MLSDPYSLTTQETALVGGLAGLIVWEVWRSWKGRDPLQAYQPTIFVGAILTYYCLIGPLRAIANGEWVDRGLDLRNTMVWAWAGSLIFYGALLIGYHSLPRWRWKSRFTGIYLPTENWRKLASRLNWVGIAFYTIGSGPVVLAQLNPFGAREAIQELSASGIDLGAWSNYFSLCLNFLIPGTILLFGCWVIDRKGLSQWLLWMLVGAGLFTTSGFRWRLVVLLAPISLLWFLARQRRPKALFLAFFASGLIFIGGYVGITRTYGLGLDVSRLEGESTSEIFNAGFREASIFLTTGGLIAQSPDRYPFVGLTPIKNVLTFFIPRQLWPQKGTNEYISRATYTLYGGPRAGGSALLNIAEYYLMFGWPSLIAMSLLLGVTLRSLYEWFLLNRYDLSAQVVYICSACFLYVVISRGYLPQVAALLSYTVIPLALLRGWAIQNYLRTRYPQRRA